jgi:hypothetical protein
LDVERFRLRAGQGGSLDKLNSLGASVSGGGAAGTTAFFAQQVAGDLMNCAAKFVVAGFTNPAMQLPVLATLKMVGPEIVAAEEGPKLLPAKAGPKAHISGGEVTGKTPAQIDVRARELGLQPKGPNPAGGRGSYVDPVTNEQRILSHPNADAPHAHVNNLDGERIGPSGEAVPRESPAAHLPILVP